MCLSPHQPPARAGRSVRATPQPARIAVVVAQCPPSRHRAYRGLWAPARCRPPPPPSDTSPSFRHLPLPIAGGGPRLASYCSCSCSTRVPFPPPGPGARVLEALDSLGALRGRAFSGDSKNAGLSERSGTQSPNRTRGPGAGVYIIL